MALPRLQESVPIADKTNGTPTFAFHIWWDEFAKQLEGTLTDLSSAVAAIAAAQATADTAIADAAAAAAAASAAAADALAAANDALTAIANAAAAQTTANTGVTNAAAAQTTANTANSTANTANSTANTVKKTDRLSGSSVYPANVLSAVDAGSNASVTVAAHSRLYGDGTSLSVGSHTFTGLSYSTKYAVYYDDPTLTDTTPTYHTTTTLSNAVANFANGRHFVGVVTTPAAAGAPTTGGSTPPGGDPADRPDFSTL